MKALFSLALFKVASAGTGSLTVSVPCTNDWECASGLSCGM